MHRCVYCIHNELRELQHPISRRRGRSNHVFFPHSLPLPLSSRSVGSGRWRVTLEIPEKPPERYQLYPATLHPYHTYCSPLSYGIFRSVGFSGIPTDTAVSCVRAEVSIRGEVGWGQVEMQAEMMGTLMTLRHGSPREEELGGSLLGATARRSMADVCK